MVKEVIVELDNSSLLEVIIHHMSEEPECQHSLKSIIKSVLHD